MSLVCYNSLSAISYLTFCEMKTVYLQILTGSLIILLYGGKAKDGKKFYNRFDICLQIMSFYFFPAVTSENPGYHIVEICSDLSRWNIAIPSTAHRISVRIDGRSLTLF